MGDSQRPDQERAVLKWGGIGGILGSVAFVMSVVAATVFVGTDAADPIGFQAIRIGRTVEDGLYLAVFVLWILHYVSLYRTLRDERLAPALFGGVFGVVGSVILAAGTLPHVMTLAVSNLYEAAGTTVAQQASLAFMWKAVYSIFDAVLAVGLILSTIGAVCLGAAMLKSAKFGNVAAWISVIIAAVGVAGAVALLWDVSTLAIVPLAVLVVFHTVAGIRGLRLSKGM